MPAARDASGRFVKGSGSWTPSQHAAYAAGRAVEWELSEKDLARIRKRVERFRGLPLQQRMAKATLKGADLMVPYIRRAGPKDVTGFLRKSTRARPAKKRIGTALQPTLGALAGPTAPHRHLVIRGHRIVTRGGRDTGQQSRSNDYVDRVVRTHRQKVMKAVSDVLFKDQSVIGNTGISVPKRGIKGIPKQYRARG